MNVIDFAQSIVQVAHRPAAHGVSSFFTAISSPISTDSVKIVEGGLHVSSGWISPRIPLDLERLSADSTRRR
jgi:hypothetical protein